MDERDLDVRNRTSTAFVELGRAPAASELEPADEITPGWRRLHAARTRPRPGVRPARARLVRRPRLARPAPHTREQDAAILDQLGLTARFWQLP